MLFDVIFELLFVCEMNVGSDDSYVLWLRGKIKDDHFKSAQNKPKQQKIIDFSVSDDYSL